jgi:hypothetical protein
MKKIMVAAIALTLLASTSAYASDIKPRKKDKAKKECKMKKEDCKKKCNPAECPPICGPSSCGK